ncbi:MAG: EF-hand domain-containing protein [Pseudomonadota bacterium]
MRTYLLAAACLAATPLPATAQLSEADLIRQFNSEVRALAIRGQSLDEITDRLLERFNQLDVDGAPGLSQADFDAHRQEAIARRRAAELNRWLVFDLNGDLQISTEELRIEALKTAREPLRSGATEVQPTQDQVEAIVSDMITRQLAADTDGDGTLTLEELAQSATRDAEARYGQGRPPITLPAQIDTNADGIFTTAEYRTAIAAVYTALDTDGDGAVVRSEAMTGNARTDEAIRRYLDRAGIAGPLNTETRQFSQARAGCEMPSVAEGTAVYFIGGYDGAALTDIHLGDPSQPAELLDVTIPAGEGPITLIATFFGDTILRLQGAGSRVTTVISTGPRIGVIGGQNIAIETASDACHIHVWGGVTAEHPDPGAFFTARLGRPLAGAISGETLATVTLSTGAVTTSNRLPGAIPVVTSGNAAEAWRRFKIYNPGGFIPLDPAAVQTAGQATKLTHRPQMAGIAQLVSDGILVRIPQKNSAATVLEDDSGAIKIGGKTFRPGFGDDAIRMNNLIYIEERPKTWVGRAPEVYLVTRPFTYPAGLTGAHSVVFLLPNGMAEPQGDRGHSRIQRIER